MIPTAEAQYRAWRLLFSPNHPIRYLILAWPIVAIPSLILSAFVSSFFDEGAGPNFAGGGWHLLFMLVIFAPMVETLIMGGVLEGLRGIVPFSAAVVLSALGWGIAHSLSAPAWGLVIWWPFLVFSTAFLVWRPRGFWTAWAVVSALHALQNSIPAILVAFDTP